MTKLTQDDFKQFYENVLLFNQISGNCNDDPKTVETYAKLFQHELGEYQKALETFDKKEILDGVLDCGFIMAHIWYLENKELFSSDYTLRGYHTMRGLYEANSRTKHDILISFEGCCYYLESIGINVKTALQRVCDNNMSKFIFVADKPILQIDDFINEEVAWIEKQGRYTGVVGHVVNNYMVFTATYDNEEQCAFNPPKIVKPSGYVDLYLDDLLPK